MRQIKFRGRRLDNGKIVYGDLIHMTSGRIGIIFDKRVAAVEVEPESVAQFVGRDINGNEVYEGDIVIKRDGNRHMVTMGDIFNVWQFQLKEAQS